MRIKNSRLLTGILAFFLFLLCFSLTTGTAVAFEGGSGTEEDPYQIANVEQLQAMEEDLTAHYILVDNIDASATETWNDGKGFEPIGDDDYPFLGTIDGQEYVIENLYIDRSDESCVGLFGYTHEDVEIKNIGLENVSISGDESIGGLIGRTSGDTRIENSFFTGNIHSTGKNYVGGIVGYQEDGTINIENSHSTATIEGERHVGGLVGFAWSESGQINDSYFSGTVKGESNVGGLIGRNDSIKVENSYSEGYVDGSHAGGLVGSSNQGDIFNSHADTVVNGEHTVGGLIGRLYGSLTIDNSYSVGKVSGNRRVGGLVGTLSGGGSVQNSHSAGGVQGDSDVGGLVGAVWREGGEIKNSYSTGEVNGETKVGGLIGYFSTDDSYYSHQPVILKSYSTGDVAGSQKVGGLIGYLDGEISDSYAIGNVSGDKSVGGLVGYNYESGDVSNSYSTGKVAGEMYVGGLVGWDMGDVEDSFWDIETSEMDESAAGTGKTTDEMHDIETYTDLDTVGLDKEWDIVLKEDWMGETWYIDDGEDYPRLGWEHPDHPVELPAEFVIDNLEIRPEYVEPGEPVELIQADIKNVGNGTGERGVKFLVEGNVEDSEVVELEGGQTTTVRFSTSRDEEGEYGVVIDAQDDSESGTFTVVEELVSPEVETLPATNITENSAVLRGEITDIGIVDKVYVGFSYRLTHTGVWKALDSETITSPQTFSKEITGLHEGMEFEFKTYASAARRSDEGDMLTFTTETDRASKKELEDLESEIENLESELKKKENLIGKQNKRIEELESSVENLTFQIGEKENEIQKLKETMINRIENLKLELETKEDIIENQGELIEVLETRVKNLESKFDTRIENLKSDLGEKENIIENQGDLIDDLESEIEELKSNLETRIENLESELDQFLGPGSSPSYLSIPAGGSQSIGVDETPITNVTVEAEGEIDGSITVQVLKQRPEGVVKKQPSGVLYQYVMVNSENVVGNMSGVSIEFRIEKDWLNTENIDKDSIQLARYDRQEDEWTEFDAEEVGEDESYVYYETEVPSLSIFAITGSKAEAFPWMWVGIGIGVIIVALIGIFFFMRKSGSGL